MLGVGLTVKSLGNHVVSPEEEEEERLEWKGLQKKQDLSLEWKRVGDEKLIIISVAVRVQHANHSATEPPFTVCIYYQSPSHRAASLVRRASGNYHQVASESRQGDHSVAARRSITGRRGWRRARNVHRSPEKLHIVDRETFRKSPSMDDS